MQLARGARSARRVSSPFEGLTQRHRLMHQSLEPLHVYFVVLRQMIFSCMFVITHSSMCVTETCDGSHSCTGVAAERSLSSLQNSPRQCACQSTGCSITDGVLRTMHVLVFTSSNLPRSSRSILESGCLATMHTVNCSYNL